MSRDTLHCSAVIQTFRILRMSELSNSQKEKWHNIGK